MMTRASLSMSAAALLLLMLVCSASAASFDFYVFSQQWPGTVCTLHECSDTKNVSPGFLVHGLWPNYYDGKYPQNCEEGEPFSLKKLDPIMTEMNTYWPSLYNPSSSFWEHEWEKHGRCCTEEFPEGELQYFETAIALNRKLDVAGILKNAGVSYGTPESGERLISIISKGLGAAPLLACNKQSGVQMLTELRLCISKDLEVMQCPSSEHSSCSMHEGIVLPPFCPYGSNDTACTQSPAAAASTSTTTTTAKGALRYIRSYMP